MARHEAAEAPASTTMPSEAQGPMRPQGHVAPRASAQRDPKRKNAMRHAWLFIVITFALTWSYEFLVVYPLVDSNLIEQPSMAATIAIGGAMLFPALGVVITRLVTREGFKDCMIKPYPWRTSLPWFAVAWLLPSVVVLLGAVAYFLAFPQDFDPHAPMLAALLDTQMQAAGVPAELPMSAQAIAMAQIASGVVLGPLLNLIPSLGEEWGWRGYLMPKVAHSMGIVPTLLATGIVWGLWHAPITALGHDYGLGYPGWPFVGIIAMCAFCVVLGTVLSYVTIRTGSCLAAAITHGGTNAIAGAATMFTIAGANPFVGPGPTGIVGGSALIVVAIIMLADLARRERKGELIIPKAGS